MKFTLETANGFREMQRNLASIKNKYILTNFGCIYSADLDDAVNGSGGELLNC